MKSKQAALNLILLPLGCLIIFYYVHQLGFQNLIDKIIGAGWRLVLLFILPIYWFFMHALGTYFTLNVQNRKRIGIMQLTLLQAIAYGVSWSQPLQGAMGEPFKILFLDKEKHDKQDFTASLLVDNTLNFFSNFIMFVVSILSLILTIQTTWVVKLACLGSISLIFLFLFVVIHIQKKGLFENTLLFLSRLGIFKKYTEKHLVRFQNIDTKIRHFYRHQRKSFLLSLCFHFLERIHGIAEFYLIFILLRPGKPVSLFSCFLIYGIVNGLDNILFFIQIGGMETYTSILLKALDLSKDSLNIAVPIFRRMRILFWIILAFLLIYPVQAMVKKKPISESEVSVA